MATPVEQGDGCRCRLKSTTLRMRHSRPRNPATSTSNVEEAEFGAVINSKSLILFVHGLASTSVGAWGKFDALIQCDPILTDFDTAFYSYPTVLIRLPFGRRSARIQELARGLKTYVDNTCHSYSDITLVAHSMGGLIAKRYLISEVQDNRPLRIKRLMLYAVPHSGAGLARAANILSWCHQQVAQLRPYSDIINEIGEQWLKLKMKDRVQLKYIVGGLDKVVDHTVP